MDLLHKLCTRLGHRIRKPLACEVHVEQGHGFGCTRWYVCRVCGEVVREEK